MKNSEKAILSIILIFCITNFILLLYLINPEFFEDILTQKEHLIESLKITAAMFLAFLPIILLLLFWGLLYMGPIGVIESFVYIPIFVFFFDCIGMSFKGESIPYLEKCGIFLDLDYLVLNYKNLIFFLLKWELIYLLIAFCFPILLFTLKDYLNRNHEAGASKKEKGGDRSEGGSRSNIPDT